MTIPSGARNEPAARRLDRAVDLLLAEGHAIVEPSLRPLIEAAAAIRAALPLLPSSLLFEERLGRRLTDARAARHPLGFASIGPLAVRARGVLPHQHRLLMAGAVGSAAVGVAGATAYAVWRANRRQA